MKANSLQNHRVRGWHWSLVSLLAARHQLTLWDWTLG